MAQQQQVLKLGKGRGSASYDDTGAQSDDESDEESEGEIELAIAPKLKQPDLMKERRKMPQNAATRKENASKRDEIEKIQKGIREGKQLTQWLIKMDRKEFERKREENEETGGTEIIAAEESREE